MLLRPQHNAILAVLLLIFSSSGVLWANQAPTVNAGPDASYKTGNLYIYLEGTASDDSTPVDSLAVQWRQISGPSTANIRSQSTLTSRLSVDSVGDYVFELRVSDGLLSATDTVIITIVQSLPFQVLAPQNLQEIEIGKPFTIKWQREPLTPCQVFFSIDSGFSWTEITVQGAALGPTITWNVPANLTPGIQGSLKVMKYQSPEDNAFGTFLLVDHPPNSALARTAKRMPASLISIDKNGIIAYHGPTMRIPLRIDIFALNGALVFGTVMSDRRVAIPMYGRQGGQVLRYRISTQEGSARYGKVLCVNK